MSADGMSGGSESEDEGPSSFPLHDAAQAGDAELIHQLMTPPPDAKPGPPSDDLVGLDDILARYVAEASAPQLPSINRRDHHECTPLHVALLHGQLEAARALLEHGASLELGCEGSPPLHVAVCVAAHGAMQEFALAAMALLLQFGADPYERDDNGRTALHWAAQMDFSAAAEAVLAAAEKKRAQLRAEQAAAAAAAKAASAAAAAGAPAPAAPAAGEGEDDDSVPPPIFVFQDKQGCTALHLAARQGHVAAVRLLLGAAAGGGGGPEAVAALCRTRSKAGHNALHLAALAGSSRCAALLAAAALDAAAGKSKLGLTPADLAARRRHTGLQTALRGQRPVQALQALAAVQEAEAGQREAQQRTLLMAPPECLFHFTCPAPITRETSDSAPPENVERLTVLTKPGWGILRCDEFGGALRWDERSQRAAIGDVLRVHDWNYVRKIQTVCDSLPDDPEAIGHLDGDTAVSRGTFAAALAAAGSVCTAVDEVVAGKAANAFCAVRPPGHHAGPLGVVSNSNDPNGSHGFCLFNNAAIGAAYAMTVHRHAGIRRVAIVDFDVHHGNGTEACVTNTIPSSSTYKFSTPYSEGVQSFAVWKPWLDSSDTQCIFFASVQGYGPKAPGYPAFVYPGSGATCDTKVLAAAKVAADEKAAAAAAEAAAAAGAKQVEAGAGALGGEQQQQQQQQQDGAAAAAAAAAGPAPKEEPAGGEAMQVDSQQGQDRGQMAPPPPPPVLRPFREPANGAVAGVAEVGRDEEIEEDPDREFEYKGGQVPPLEGPRVIDVGIPGFGSKPALWRRSWRDKILPSLSNFKPDLIFVCAGFDAHKKDEINFRYIGVTERDYEWLTEQLVAVANRCCQGRIVSVLEGGYRLQGGIMSAFARSVAAHVKALAEPNATVWDPREAKAEREHEKKVRAELEAKKAEAAHQKAAAREAYVKARLAAVAAAAAAPAAPAGTAPAAAGTSAPAAGAEEAEDGGTRRKRRRGAGSGVDYVELNRQLEEEAAARRAAGGSGGG